MPALAVLPKNRMVPYFESALTNVRYEILQNSYIEEAQEALTHGLYRSAIGNIWNAVIDDLRMKVLHRSPEIFSKAVNVGRENKTYEDIQDHVTDDALIEAAYKIGVIDWEARKVLKHAKETRHIFSGHPRSTKPSVFKTAAMFEDCVRYVLAEPMPSPIIDLDEYLAAMDSPDFDRSEIAIKSSVLGLPEIYTNQLIHRLFGAYIANDSSSELRSNIELVAPILWKELEKELRRQVVHRVDRVMKDGSETRTKEAFKFVRLVKGSGFLSPKAKAYILQPHIERLRDNLDRWTVENDCVSKLFNYAAMIPDALVGPYVSAITHTYVGSMGHSSQWRRTNFYADYAAVLIPKMFAYFDDEACAAFVDGIKGSEILRGRIRTPEKLDRLRELGALVQKRMSFSFANRKFVNALVDPKREKEFWQLVRK